MITTGGFTPTSFARFVPSDPSLVAFNPGAITAGASDVLKLYDTFNRIKAYKDQQEELAALKTKRLAAAAAGYDTSVAQAGADIPTFKALADLRMAKIGSEQRLLPKREKADEATLDETIDLAPDRLKFAKMKIGEDIKTLPYLARAQRTGAAAQYAGDETTINLESMRRDILKSSYEDKLKNATSDAERTRLKAEYENDLLKAQAQEARAHGNYFDNGGSPKTKPTKAQMAKVVAQAIATLKGLPTASGKDFATYLSETRDDKGNVKTPTHIPLIGDVGGVELDPVGETYVKHLMGLQQELSKYSVDDGVESGKANAGVSDGEFEVGKTYVDANGNRATYLGNGKWKE